MRRKAPKTKELKFENLGVNVNIRLRGNNTVIGGDSATGKTYLYNVVEDYMTTNKLEQSIRCINDLDMKHSEDVLINELKELTDAIILIDNADTIFDTYKKLEQYVLFDNNNFYIVFSRYFATQFTELADVEVDKDNISIKYMIEI